MRALPSAGRHPRRCEAPQAPCDAGPQRRFAQGWERCVPAKESYRYTAFGQPTIFDKNGAEVATTQVKQPFMWTGGRHDFEEGSGLVQMRLRYYDPAAGRFVSRDPLGLWGDPGQGGNAQAYCKHNPVNFVDPVGTGPGGGEGGRDMGIHDGDSAKDPALGPGGKDEAQRVEKEFQEETERRKQGKGTMSQKDYQELKDRREGIMGRHNDPTAQAGATEADKENAKAAKDKATQDDARRSAKRSEARAGRNQQWQEGMEQMAKDLDEAGQKELAEEVREAASEASQRIDKANQAGHRPPQLPKPRKGWLDALKRAGKAIPDIFKLGGKALGWLALPFDLFEWLTDPPCSRLECNPLFPLGGSDHPAARCPRRSGCPGEYRPSQASFEGGCPSASLVFYWTGIGSVAVMY